MKYGSKDFYDAMDTFEKWIKQYGRLSDINRASKEDVKKFKCFYDNGETNRLFMLFLCGIEFGKYLIDHYYVKNIN